MWYIKKPFPNRVIYIYHKHEDKDYNIIAYTEKIKNRNLFCHRCGSVVPKCILLQCQLLIC